MKRIAIYGKGGIGKSTTVSNMSAALASKGLTVVQVGCDPKADSTISLRNGQELRPVLDVYREKVKSITLEDMYIRGYGGVICVEAGGPTPGIGCAGRGVAKALELLKEKGAEEKLKPDVMFFDVLGDVVCGGFSMPLRRNYTDAVYVISSGEQMAIHAAMNLGLAMDNFKRRGHNGLEGIIGNKRNVPDEDEKLLQLSDDLECPIVQILEYSEVVKKASDQGLTVCQAFPGDPVIDSYVSLAEKLMGQKL